jgi:hypothetical protein
MENRTQSRTPDSDPQHCRYQIQNFSANISILSLNKCAVTSIDQSNPPPFLLWITENYAIVYDLLWNNKNN